jgi:hypothetical protein
MGQKNASLQGQAQAQQEQINKGSMAQQVGGNILKEIAVASVKDPVLEDVLTKNGYSVKANSSPTPSSSPAAPSTSSATSSPSPATP